MRKNKFHYTFPAAKPGEATAPLQLGNETPAPPPAPAPTLNRKARRKNQLFNKLLKRRLEKDGPVGVEVAPDGSLHVTVDTREEP